jgi:GNAT superfamily N-acetyltransferase
MQTRATPSSLEPILPLREGFLRERNWQIVHDSIHTRPGWTSMYLLTAGGAPAGYGFVAIAGPWKDRPTIFEFHVLPEWCTRAFDLFEALVEASGAKHMEIQSSDRLLHAMLHTYARDVWAEKIVFQDHVTTTLPANGAVLYPMTPASEVQLAIEERAGCGDWRLELDGTTAGTGSILFHYNRPYADIAMEVAAPFRRRGYGAYLVQELKRMAYELGAIPAARCSPDNVGSRRTLQKAGFVPFASILNGSL